MGTGNLAWHLCAAYTALKGTTVFVYGRSGSESLSRIGKKFKVKIVTNIHMVPTGANLYFYCVPDDQIRTISSQINITYPDAIVCHTSGATDITELAECTWRNRAVFYPLQTFTAGEKLDWAEVPVMIEAERRGLLETLHYYAVAIGAKPAKISGEDRQRLHLAAVLVNNFSNALFVAAEELVQDQFKFLLPLINKTAEKAAKPGPRKAQTGPARRGDNKTMARHLAMLKNEELQQLYKLLSALIQKQQNA